jgi:transcriptional regulator with XRE-family HTH domain
MNDPRSFGRVVREARLAKGMSMGQLAAAVHRSTASVRRWERDEGVPAAGIMDDLVRVLDLTPDDVALLDRETAAPPTPPPRATTPPPQPASIQASIQKTQAASKVTGIAPIVESGPTGVKSWLADLYDPDKPWLGYLRAALTVMVLIILAWLLVWALGGLFDTLGEFWDSMWADGS